MSQVARRRFSATVSVGKMPLPPGISAAPLWVTRSADEAGDVLALERDRSGRGCLQAADGLEQRRLAGAVGAEQGDDLAPLHLEVDAEEDLHRAVADVDALALAGASRRRGRRIVAPACRPASAPPSPRLHSCSRRRPRLRSGPEWGPSPACGCRCLTSVMAGTPTSSSSSCREPVQARRRCRRGRRGADPSSWRRCVDPSTRLSATSDGTRMSRRSATRRR